MEEIKQIIQTLLITPEEKEQLLQKLKVVQKNLDISEFKYKRTIVDKTAITNILNASIAETEKQKRIIENAKDKINRNLTEMDRQKKLIEEKTVN